MFLRDQGVQEGSGIWRKGRRNLVAGGSGRGPARGRPVGRENCGSKAHMFWVRQVLGYCFRLAGREKNLGGGARGKKGDRSKQLSPIATKIGSLERT